MRCTIHPIKHIGHRIKRISQPIQLNRSRNVLKVHNDYISGNRTASYRSVVYIFTTLSLIIGAITQFWREMCIFRNILFASCEVQIKMLQSRICYSIVSIMVIWRRGLCAFLWSDRRGWIVFDFPSTDNAYNVFWHKCLSNLAVIIFNFTVCHSLSAVF